MAPGLVDASGADQLGPAVLERAEEAIAAEASVGRRGQRGQAAARDPGVARHRARRDVRDLLGVDIDLAERPVEAGDWVLDTASDDCAVRPRISVSDLRRAPAAIRRRLAAKVYQL